jgi:hypothetical protein
MSDSGRAQPAAAGLLAGAAERLITPAVGGVLAGYASRAAGDLHSRYRHDDLHARALVLRQGALGWGLLVLDLLGLDAAGVEHIRRAVARRTDLAPEAILVCATHTHAGPPACAVAGAVAPENLNAVRADGALTAHYGHAAALSPTAYYAADVDPAWRAWMLSQAAEALVAAWEALRPAECAYGAAEVSGVASSRRVRLADGSWADPRREPAPAAEVIARTEIDPALRVLALRERGSGAPIAAVVNYSTHPWVFNTSGLSAELAGAVARGVAAGWAPAGAQPPVVLFVTGPEGDVSLIWNINVEQVWRLTPGESLAAALPRRERAFASELARLSARVAERAVAVLGGLGGWRAQARLAAARREVLLPLKPGYRPPADLSLADWQRAAPDGFHNTEVQLLRAGPWALLGLPGEPFTALGQAIRAGGAEPGLLLAALANDFGAVSYLARPEDFALGGYELTVTPAAPEAGEALVRHALALLRACPAPEAET